jgi:hypothetical protein
VFTPETVPSEFVEKYTNKTEKNIQWWYHTLSWEDWFLEGNYSVAWKYSLEQHLTCLETEEERESERLLAKKLFRVITDDCYKILELLENKKVTVLYKSSPDPPCRLVWV